MTVELHERTQELVNSALPGDQALDVKVRLLLEAEYLRRLAQYRRTDQMLTRKYGMDFAAFLAGNVTQQRGYSWEAEKDAMDWETAVAGIETVERLLANYALSNMIDAASLRQEALTALERLWFIQSVVEVERTDATLSIRLYIRRDLFVQLFYGSRSGSLFFALIEGERRIFGIDLQNGHWHEHPFNTPERHIPLTCDLGPAPLSAFLARVEELLLAENLL